MADRFRLWDFVLYALKGVLWELLLFSIAMISAPARIDSEYCVQKFVFGVEKRRFLWYN